MDIRIFEEAGDVAEAAVALLSAQVLSNPGVNVAVPTGKTPMEMYRRLVAAHRAGASDLSRVRWFALDEFLGIPPDQAGSFHLWLLERLILPAGLDPARFHSLRGDTEDPVAEAAAYEARISDAGGLDLALLGLGHNGHLAFNEPGTPEDSHAGPRPLTSATREANAYLFPAGKVPTHGMSMGLGTLGQARRLVLLATGAPKAAAVEALTRPDITVTACPAALLLDHPDAVVLLDRAAASRIDRVG